MSTLNGKSVASTYDQVVKRQDSYSATGNQIEIMDDSGVIKTTPLYLDSVNSRVGIGTASPAKDLDVAGEIRASTGLLFGTDTAAANTLDDYEEGTWTPSLLFGGAAVSMTYGTNGLTGTYTKVGNQVTAKGWIQLTAKGSSTGVVTIGGLPFTSLGTARTYSSCSLRMENISFADFPQAFTNVGVTTIFVEELSNAGVLSSLAETDFANNSALMVTVIYTT